MYQLMINRKNSKKGFTLVEVIVVLVILAILAAIMIPAMTGWIDKAREKAILVNARTFLLAAQTIASEEYGENTGYDATSYTTDNTDVAGLTGVLPGEGTLDSDAKGKITSGSYKEGDFTARWNGTVWTVS